jgi:DNA-binding transcriptional regulator YiaG
MAKKATTWRKRLDALGAKLRLTHAQLAEELGVTRGALRNWLYGHRTPKGTAARLILCLCEKHGISVS